MRSVRFWNSTVTEFSKQPREPLLFRFTPIIIARFDLLIADIQLPDGSGTEVGLELQHHCPEATVLFASGTPIDGWRVRDVRNLRMLPIGKVDFLLKPFRGLELIGRVEALLNGKRTADFAV